MNDRACATTLADAVEISWARVHQRAPVRAPLRSAGYLIDLRAVGIACHFCQIFSGAPHFVSTRSCVDLESARHTHTSIDVTSPEKI
jgi:hypothetical protein